MNESGQISINTENILPIIKKWLYSERDIFIRELVSNAADAILKFEKIALVEECEERRQEPRIDIELDAADKILRVSDTGLGMTAEEIKKYINQVAFSGIQDFVKKYQDKEDSEQVIGHFGLGFYSSFMVAERVEIESLSYQKDAQPAHWQSVGDANYQLGIGTREKVGTTVTLHVSPDSVEVLDPAYMRTVLTKFCAFMKYPVYLQGELISDSRPVWTANPSQVSDDDYLKFFRKVFPADEDPLFWVHLNLDFPLKLRGVLYFPRLGHEMSAMEGQVKLFCNQVFVEDNCKELIPEFLTLLKGVVDCPDLPLNVSRSALQKDSNVRKVAQHITKKVADKLSGLFKNKRDEFEKYWEDIHPFVKYAMMRDTDFCDKMLGQVIYKCSDDKYRSFDEYLEQFGEKTESRLLYATDVGVHASFIKMLKGEGLEALLANRMIDQHFLPYIEMKSGTKYRFQRVDADISKFVGGTDTTNELVDPNDQKTPSEKLTELFKNNIKNEELQIKVESLKHSNAAALLIVDENMRRLREISRSGVLGGSFGAGMMTPNTTLVINRDSPAIKNLLNLAKSFNKDAEVKLIVEQIYDLATLQQGQFSPETMQSFIERSTEILGRIGISTPSTQEI